jgi:hemin uptake protein HemP
MAAPSGDKLGDATGNAGTPPVTARSVVMSGNRLDSRELFAAEREIIIAHGEDNYRLRLTSQNKLILTK